MFCHKLNIYIYIQYFNIIIQVILVFLLLFNQTNRIYYIFICSRKEKLHQTVSNFILRVINLLTEPGAATIYVHSKALHRESSLGLLKQVTNKQESYKGRNIEEAILKQFTIYLRTEILYQTYSFLIEKPVLIKCFILSFNQEIQAHSL